MVNLVVQGYDEITLKPKRRPMPSGLTVTIADGNAELSGPGSKPSKLLDDKKTLSDNAAKRLNGKGVKLALSSENSIDLEFNLPRSPLKDLPGMIGAEILYRSPFGDGQSYSIWEAQETEAGSWDIRAAVILRNRIEPILEALHYANAQITQVERITEEGKTGFVAYPAWAVGSVRRTYDPLVDMIPTHWRLPCAALFALIISTFLIHIQTGFSLSRLENQVESSRADLSVVARAAQSEREIYDLEKSSLQRLLLPGMITNAFSDEVWLQQINIDTQTLSVSGFAPSAAEITRIMTAFPGLIEVGFSSPVTRDNTQNIERFRIGAEFDTNAFTVNK